MRNLLLLLLPVFTFMSGCGTSNTNNESGFTIDAEIRGTADNTMIYLQQVKGGEIALLDSQSLSKSKVRFEGTLDQPDILYLQIGKTRKAINIFAENSKIQASVNIDSLNMAVVSGSSIHDDLMEFKRVMEMFDEKSTALNEAYRQAASSSDTSTMKEILAEYDHYRVEQRDMIKQFVVSKPESYISPFIISRYLSQDMEVSELGEVLATLDSSIHDSREYIVLYDRVVKLQNVAVGKIAVDFALNDTTGNPIAISSFRGKYLLIDFWASWCGPCRKENPNVVKLYNDYKDKGFEIIGVSLDEDRRRWIQAIHDDQLKWAHVSDLKGWASEAGRLYSITAIPATVLLDRSGKIVAKNLRGDALRKKLEQLYSEELPNS